MGVAGSTGSIRHIEKDEVIEDLETGKKIQEIIHDSVVVNGKDGDHELKEESNTIVDSSIEDIANKSINIVITENISSNQYSNNEINLHSSYNKMSTVSNHEEKQFIIVDIPNNDVSFEDNTDNYDNHIGNDFYCYICMDTKLKSDGYTLPCSHEFCKPCLESYYISKISEANINLNCFHPVHHVQCIADNNDNLPPHNQDKIPICNTNIPEHCIIDILQDNKIIMNKYLRFKFMKDYPSARECPKCKAFNIQGSNENTSLICEVETCKYEFCFIHADAHPGESCVQYESRNLEVNQPSLDLIAASTKPCPGCGMAIFKSGGCNHIKCSHCKQAFCWLCLAKIEDDIFPSHFQWWNVSGTCTNLQMDDAVEPSSYTRIFASIAMVLQIVILGPIVAICTLISVMICGCCIKKRFFREFVTTNLSNWGIVWMVLLVIIPIGAVCVGVTAVFAAICLIIVPIWKLIGYLLKRGNVDLGSPVGLVRRWVHSMVDFPQPRQTVNATPLRSFSDVESRHVGLPPISRNREEDDEVGRSGSLRKPSYTSRMEVAHRV